MLYRLFPLDKLASKKASIIVNIAFLLVMAFWVNAHISFRSLVDSIGEVPLLGSIGVLVANTLVLGVYGARLAQLLQFRFWPATATAIIGFGMNDVLPFRLGELAKIAYARQLYGISAPKLMTASAAEKLLDLSTLAAISAVLSNYIFASYLNEWLSVLLMIVTFGLSGLVALLVGLRLWRQKKRKIHPWFLEALSTIKAQHSAHKLLRLLILTIFIWCMTVGSVLLMFHQVFNSFTVVDALAVTLILSLAVAIPGAPAGLGVVEAGVVAYLTQVMGVDADKSLASALVFHFIVLTPQILISGLILTRASLMNDAQKIKKARIDAS